MNIKIFILTPLLQLCDNFNKKYPRSQALPGNADPEALPRLPLQFALLSLAITII
jgi:hypothetical protein